MPARFAAASALVIALAAAGAQSQKSIIVTVLDPSGTPVRKVSPADLAVREGTEPREIVDVKPATEPMAIALLVDNTKPMAGQETPTRELRAGLTTFVQKIQQAMPETAIGIWEFAGAGVMAQKPTVKTAGLTKNVSHMFPRQQSGRVMLEARVEASRELSHRGSSPRRVIVSVSFNSAEASTILPQDVANAMHRAGVNYWAVSIQANPDAVGNSQGNGAARDLIMTRITAASGGSHLTGVTAISLESQLAQVADALLSQQVVAFARPDGAPEAIGSIEAVSKKGLKVLTTPLIQ